MFILDTVAESYIVSTILDISANFKKALQYGYETDQFIADASEIVRTKPEECEFY